MSKVGTTFKSETAQQKLIELYDEKLSSLQTPYETIDVQTSFGKTRVTKMGNPQGEPILLFHGYNAGGPLTLEAVLPLTEKYCFYAVDTIGQATKSENVYLNIKDDSLGKWGNEVIEGLQLDQVITIGISYGAFITEKIIKHYPKHLKKVILVVPSGIVGGDPVKAITQLTFPLIRYNISKSDKNLKKFLDAFVPEDDFLHKLLKEIMTGVKLDTRIPPLLKPQDVSTFNKPVYVMGAENDVYFPAHKLLPQSQKVFSNLAGTHTLKGSKHMPGKEHYEDIQSKIAEWIEA